MKNLEIFKDLIPEKKQNRYYKALKTGYFPEKEIIEEWVENFIDRDNDIVKKFQRKDGFRGALWEFYLFQLFKELEMEVDFSKNRPDFLINSPFKINVEAVVAKPRGDKELNSIRKPHDIFPIPFWEDKNYENFMHEAITRCSNSITSKQNLYKNGYQKCEWVKQKDPFVIALSSHGQLRSGQEFIFPMQALLYGAYYTKEAQGLNINKFNNLIKKDYIIKPQTENSKIDLNLFSKEEYKNLSAVIFSCTATLGKLSAMYKSKNNYINEVLNIRHDSEDQTFRINLVNQETPEEIGDGIYIFHNPNAKNPIPEDLFDKLGIVQVFLKNNQFEIKGNNLPIVARLNSTFPFPRLKKELFEIYNPDMKVVEGYYFNRLGNTMQLIIKGEGMEVNLEELGKNLPSLRKKIDTAKIGEKYPLLCQINPETNELISFVDIEIQ